MKVLRYGEYSLCNSMVYDFISNFNESILVESVSESVVSEILKSLRRDLKFNFVLITKFGFGVTALYPIVEKLIKNGSLNIDLTPENVVLMSLASLSIAYLDEGGGVSPFSCQCSIKKDDCKKCISLDVSKDDARNLLEELKLKGIGNGIIRKLVSCVNSIFSMAKSLFNKTPYMVKGIIDMLGYTSFLVPTMNAISAIVGKYDLNLDTLPGNLLSLGVGILSFISKNGIDKLISKLKKSDAEKSMNISSDVRDRHLLINEQ